MFSQATAAAAAVATDVCWQGTECPKEFTESVQYFIPPLNRYKYPAIVHKCAAAALQQSVISVEM